MSTPRLVEPQKSARAAGPRRPHDECPRPWRLLALSSSRRKLVEPEEVGRVEDVHLAHHVRVLLIAAHEPDHPSTGRTLDHGLKALPHQLAGVLLGSVGDITEPECARDRRPLILLKHR